MCPALDPEYTNRRSAKNPDVRYWVERASPYPFVKNRSDLFYPMPDDIDPEENLKTIPSLTNPSMTFLERLSSDTWDEKHLDDRLKEVWRVCWKKEDGNSAEVVLKMVRLRALSAFLLKVAQSSLSSSSIVN